MASIHQLMGSVPVLAVFVRLGLQELSLVFVPSMVVPLSCVGPTMGSHPISLVTRGVFMSVFTATGSVIPSIVLSLT